jgi:hypothetical protein
MVRPARQGGLIAAILVKHRRSIPVKEQTVIYPYITRWSYGWVVPLILLLAAVPAADGVSYVLVGSAGLHLRGHCGPVGDIDAVPLPDQANLERLHDVFTDLAVGSKCPPARLLTTLDLVQVRTSYGQADCLLARGRRDWARLAGGAETSSLRSRGDRQPQSSTAAARLPGTGRADRAADRRPRSRSPSAPG